MKSKTASLILMVFLIFGCTKEETREINLKGILKGKITTFDEYGEEIDDNANITIQVEGTDPLLSGTTNNDGSFEISNVPTGTYNIIASKDGYGDNQSQGVVIIGGKEPTYISMSLIEKSSTTIEDLYIEVQDNQLIIAATINHNVVITPEMWNDFVFYKMFLHKDSNPSGSNYLNILSLSGFVESGVRDTSIIPFEGTSFSSGDTIYAVAYGCYRWYWGYYDILLNKRIYTSLSEPSNIASTVLP